MANQFNSFWTTDRIDELKARWNAGETSSEICRAMAATSRNAVIGKAHRLGLFQNNKPKRRANGARKPRRNYGNLSLRLKDKGKPPAMANEPAPTFQKPIRFFELKDQHCRWPGAGEMPDLLFCGALVVEGKSYCACHCAIAFAGAPRVKGPRS